MSTSKTRPGRPVRPAVAALPLLDALDETHRQMLQYLGQLASLLDQLDGANVDDTSRKLAGEICGFFDATARAHHQAEEQLVFPSLLSSGDAELVQHVQRLQQDHGWLEEDWLEIEPQLKAVAEGYNWFDPDVLRSAIPIFSDLYREHIALEESTIYPEARRRDPDQRTGAAGRKAAK